MRQTRLGRTGLHVSRLCLGTMTFGLQCDEATSSAILDAAAEAGITFLDTADVYPLGGDARDRRAHRGDPREVAEGRRHDFIVATKCFGPMVRAAVGPGSSRKHVLDAIDGSLRRLGTDYVDLYQLHGFDEGRRSTRRCARSTTSCARQRPLRRLLELPRLPGRARAGRSEALGVARFDSVQPRYNLLFREIERELLPLCRQEGVA